MADLWDKLKGTVGKVLPILGNAILPGVGGLAGSIIANVLDCENTPEALETAFAKATPEQIKALKDAEFRHKEELIKLGLEQDKIYILDVQNARHREVEIVKATGKKDRNLYALAWVIMGGFIGLILALVIGQFFYSKVLATDPLLSMLLGAMSTNAGMVVGYFFGSSKSSADKTDVIAHMTGNIKK